MDKIRNDLLALILVPVLTGCNTVVAQFPSVQNCERVTYDRVYNKAFIQMTCEVPYAVSK